jgi:hypothetical protein
MVKVHRWCRLQSLNKAILLTKGVLRNDTQSYLFDQSTIKDIIDSDEVVRDYQSFFSLFDWSLVDQWEAQKSPRGRPAHSESAYIKAFLIRIREGMIYTSQLHRFLTVTSTPGY